MKGKGTKNNAGWKICDFEENLEVAKKKGVEIILAIQEFVVNSTKKTLERVWGVVAEYWLLLKKLRSDSGRSDTDQVLRVNDSINTAMRSLDIEETYLNIIRRYSKEIQKLAPVRGLSQLTGELYS